MGAGRMAVKDGAVPRKEKREKIHGNPLTKNRQSDMIYNAPLITANGNDVPSQMCLGA